MGCDINKTHKGFSKQSTCSLHFQSSLSEVDTFKAVYVQSILSKQSTRSIHFQSSLRAVYTFKAVYVKSVLSKQSTCSLYFILFSWGIACRVLYVTLRTEERKFKPLIKCANMHNNDGCLNNIFNVN
jgi:hypothetical protein